jgi:hypothetical protein
MARNDRYAFEGQTFSQVIDPYRVHKQDEVAFTSDLYNKPEYVNRYAGDLIKWHNKINMSESKLLNSYLKYRFKPLWSDDLYGEHKQYYLRAPKDYLLRCKLLYHRSVVTYQDL